MLTCFASLQRDVPSPLPCTLPPTAVIHEDDKRAKRKGVGKADEFVSFLPPLHQFVRSRLSPIWSKMALARKNGCFVVFFLVQSNSKQNIL